MSAVHAITSDKAETGSKRFLKDALVPPRIAPLVNCYGDNIREDVLASFLDAVWTDLLAHLAEPVRVKETGSRRTVTFMGAARFTVDKSSGQVSVSQLERKNGKVAFVRDNKPTVIDLPVRLNGFWLDAFLVPWRDRIGDCLIDHRRPGACWLHAIKAELQRAVGRSTHWYRLRCHLRDALQLDPQVVLWCRKGRPAYRDYVTQVQYNSVLAERATYQCIQNDSPNLVWLYNFLRAEKLHPKGDQPVAKMKAWLLKQRGVSEAGWRLIANGKEQDFKHIIDFVDADGGIAGRHTYLPSWLRLLGKLRRGTPIPRPLRRVFVHDAYEGLHTEEGDRVQFRGLTVLPGVLRAILEEGERRLARGSHNRFIEEDVVEVLTWLQAEQPVLDKNQQRQGWKYLAERAVTWRVEREACDTLKELTWQSLLPETQIDHWRIVPLTDAWQLRREGLSQRHCADQHVGECLSGQYRHFSVRTERGKPVATIGIERQGMNWSVFGFRGFANRSVGDALLGLDAEVLQRYSDLWGLTVPASKPLPPSLEREPGLRSSGACAICGEAEDPCPHIVAVRDGCSGELIGGDLCAVYDLLQHAIEEEIRYAALNGEFRFSVTDACRLIAYEINQGREGEPNESLLSAHRGEVKEMIFERLQQYSPDVNVTIWEFLDGAPGTATIYKGYWAKDPASVVEWLRQQFSDGAIPTLQNRGKAA